MMLQGLYKSFNSVNSLLMLGILLLLFYSLASGASQLFGITVIAVILLFTNIQYILSVKENRRTIIILKMEENTMDISFSGLP